MSDAGRPHGFAIQRHDVVTSTSDEASRLVLEGAADKTVVWALEQKSGRGRLGRSWSSPRGNLYTTAILVPGKPLAELQQLSFVAAVAVFETVRGLLPDADLMLKWPNDVLLGGRKVAGILLETVARDGIYAALLGVGINLHHFPADARYGATALALHVDRAIPIEETLDRYLAKLSEWYALWQAEGFGPIRAAWSARARWFGETVTVDLGVSLVTGTFEDIDQNGAMIVRDGQGARHRIAAGDVRRAGE